MDCVTKVFTNTSNKKIEEFKTVTALNLVTFVWFFFHCHCQFCVLFFMFCKLWKRKINQSAKRVDCDICRNTYHVLCVPGVNKYDNFCNEITKIKWTCTLCIQSILPFCHIVEDDEFLMCLSENWPVSYNTDLDKLRLKTFNPFELNNDCYNCPLFNTDPDFHYYNLVCSTLSTCDYFLEDQFNMKCQELSLTSKCFSMMHGNIRSIPKNFQNFELFMSNLDIKFTVMAFTETWLNYENVGLYNIEGYNMETAYRTTRKGGGVSLYIAESVNYTLRTDLDVFSEIMESRFLEIDKNSINSTRNVIIGVIYRPPNSDIDVFISQLSGLLDIIRKDNKSCYLLGDYNININLFNVDKHQPTAEFVESLFSQEFVPLINKPTRDVGCTAILIDNIFCNDIPSEISLTGIFYCNITDHYPVFHIERSQMNEPKALNIKKRSYNEKIKTKFIGCISKLDWTDVLCLSNPQECYSMFLKKKSQISMTCVFLIKDI